jgi:hypothetical protein
VKEFDMLILDALSYILESPINPQVASQITLGLKHGGIGIRAAQFHSIAGSIASWSQCEERVRNLVLNKQIFDIYQHMDPTLIRNSFDDDIEFNTYSSIYITPHEIFITQNNIDAVDLNNQKAISQFIDQKNIDNYITQLSIKDKARLTICMAYGANAWINLIPIKSNLIPSNQFLIIMRMWLGIPMFKNDGTVLVCNKCQMELDEEMVHALKCKRGGNLTKRHHIIRNTLFMMMKDSNWYPELEKNNLCIGQERPADLYIPVYQSQKPAAIDVAITTPLQDRFMAHIVDTPLYAATVYERQKISFYEDKLNYEEIEFYPFVMESFGGIGEYAQGVLKRLCYDQRARFNRQYSEILNWRKQQLSVKLWRANAEMIMERLPSQYFVNNDI